MSMKELKMKCFSCLVFLLFQDRLWVMEQQQQYAIKCDLCGTNENATKFCMHCRETMCGHCSEIHSKSIASQEHEIIRRSQASSYDILDDMKCSVHQNKLCEMHCVTCDKIVCTRCVTDDHRGHEFDQLDKLFKTKPKEFETLLKDFDQIVTPKYLRECEILEKRLLEIENSQAATETEIHDQTEAFKTCIGTLEEKLKRMLQVVIKSEKQPIKNALASKRENYIQLQKTIKEMQVVLEKHHIANIPLLLKNIRQRLFALSSEEDIAIHTEATVFEKYEISLERLETFFGQFSVGAPGDLRKRTLPPVKIPISIKKVIEIRGTSPLSSVTIANEKELLISGDRYGFQISKESGNVQMEVFQKFGLRGPAAVLSNGLLVARDGKCPNQIVKILSNQVRTVFMDLNFDIITGLHVTRKSEILVSVVQAEDCSGEVLKYDKLGETALRIYQKESGEALFAYPTSVTENLNGDIWVVDKETDSIEIIDKFGLYRFTYKNSDILKNFKPHSLTSDSNGNILISDRGNQTIHVIDRDGRALRYLDTASLGISPTGLAVEAPGQLWALDSDKRCCYLLNYF